MRFTITDFDGIPARNSNLHPREMTFPLNKIGPGQVMEITAESKADLRRVQACAHQYAIRQRHAGRSDFRVHFRRLPDGPDGTLRAGIFRSR